MANVALHISNLGKSYYITHAHRKQGSGDYKTLQEDLRALPRRLFGLMRAQNATREMIWALRNISLEINEGEVVGIIGQNGAGKSTLLKILSRITDPTEGEAEVYGRVGSLLEVGTGFHPELTGRENIYLNGTILGMRKLEITRKFDDIVAFAEVERFIDTPVKYYSSGMYVRLAFAVAAHLEPEILIVDEVLAVGDAAFQKKCLGKMEDVAHEGRTVLFVSHNMGAVASLCKRVVLLEKGTVVQDGPAGLVVDRYLIQGSGISGQKTWTKEERPGNQSLRIISVSLKNKDGAITSTANISEDLLVDIEYEILKPMTRAMFSLVLWDSNNYVVFGSLSNTEDNAYHARPLEIGRYHSVCRLYGNLLNNGMYYISIIGAANYWPDSFRAEYVLAFEALDDGVLKGDYPGGYGGVVRPKLNWSTLHA